MRRKLYAMTNNVCNLFVLGFDLLYNKVPCQMQLLSLYPLFLSVAFLSLLMFPSFVVASIVIVHAYLRREHNESHQYILCRVPAIRTPCVLGRRAAAFLVGRTGRPNCPERLETWVPGRHESRVNEPILYFGEPGSGDFVTSAFSSDLLHRHNVLIHLAWAYRVC